MRYPLRLAFEAGNGGVRGGNAATVESSPSPIVILYKQRVSVLFQHLEAPLRGFFLE